MVIRLLPLLLLMLLPSLALAHGPTPQKAVATVTLAVPVETAWEAVKQFGDWQQWHPDIAASEGDGKHESGGTRSLTFKNGEVLVDELDFYSSQTREYSYRLKTPNVKALPVSSYSVSLQVAPGADGGHSVVTLKSRFYRGDTGNSPPEHLSDAAAVAAMNQFFQRGLEGLQKKLQP